MTNHPLRAHVLAHPDEPVPTCCFVSPAFPPLRSDVAPGAAAPKPSDLSGRGLLAPDAIRHSLPSASERDASTGAGDFLRRFPLLCALAVALAFSLLLFLGFVVAS